MSSKLKCHVFICTSCSYEEGQATVGPTESLRDEVKAIAKERWDKKTEVRINKSGCLGKCKKGIAAVLYPQEKWLTELKIDDSTKVIEEIEKCLNIKA